MVSPDQFKHGTKFETRKVRDGLIEATDQILATAELTRNQLFADTVEKTLGLVEMPTSGNASTPKAPDGSTATGADNGNSGDNASNDQQAPSETSESTPQKAKRTGRGAKDEQAIDGLLDQQGTDADEHPPMFHALNQLSRLGMFIPLVAQDGAGARRVLREWVGSQQLWNRSQVVWTNLATVNKHRRSSDAIATSITRLTFERTFDYLRKLKTRADEWEQLIYENPTHTYDDERFLNLNGKVKDALDKQGIRL